MQNARKKNKNARIYSYCIISVLLVFSVYFCVTFVKQEISISSMHQQSEEILFEINAQKEYSKVLKESLKPENENKRIEDTAREKLGYLKNDEILFIDSSEK